MRKLTFAIAAAVAAATLIGAGGQAHAQVGPVSQQVQAGATFTVEYDCESFAPSPTIFTFQGVTVVAPCGAAQSGTSSAQFTAPGVAGTYVGSADPCGSVTLKIAGLRSAGVQNCPVPVEPFTVIVVGAVTTTTVAPTTVAPTTSAVGAVPPAPTTTAAAAAALPATGPDRTGTGVAIALVLLALGGGLILATRRRGDTSTG